MFWFQFWLVFKGPKRKKRQKKEFFEKCLERKKSWKKFFLFFRFSFCLFLVWEQNKQKKVFEKKGSYLSVSPWFFRHLKYLRFWTSPSFFPGNSESKAKPIHSPSAKEVSPMNLTSPWKDKKSRICSIRVFGGTNKQTKKKMFIMEQKKGLLFFHLKEVKTNNKENKIVCLFKKINYLLNGKFDSHVSVSQRINFFFQNPIQTKQYKKILNWPRKQKKLYISSFRLKHTH